MITNFEKITHELTDDELSIVPYFVKSFQKYTKENPIKAVDIVSRWNQSQQPIRLSQPRLRKICNHIRSNSLLPLIATSSGYYVSNDKTEIDKQIKSLIERANSILKCAEGLKQINH
jgi:hypothetical protein